MCERELETKQNCNILAITAFLCRFPELLNWRPGGPLCWLSLLHLVTNWSGLQTDFLSSPSYIIVQRPLLLVGVTIALIQPIQGQGYNILINRMHLLFTKVHFLFWQPGQVVGQYTTLGWAFQGNLLLPVKLSGFIVINLSYVKFMAKFRIS